CGAPKFMICSLRLYDGGSEHMVRRSPRWRAPKEEIDHAAMFAEEAKRIVRNSGLLMAYRSGAGLLLAANRSPLTEELLHEAGLRCTQAYVALGHNDRLSALEIAAKHARLAYTGHFWIATPCSGEPIRLSSGDEYFSIVTVSAIIEQMR